MPSEPSLLTPGEPHPFAVEREDGQSPFLIVCEHAGRRIPQSLGTLGLAGEHLAKHFMWDIGALDLAREIAARLDAPLAYQPYSRMICDSNRHPNVETFIPPKGEDIDVPANAAITPADRAQRRAEIWQPFHDGVADLIDQRIAAGQPTLFVTIHSFTPVFFGESRALHFGVLYDRDRTLAPALFKVLQARHGDKVAENEPYIMERLTDYTVPVHGVDRGLPSVEIEVRNDLLSETRAVAAIADDLADALRRAAADIDAGT